MSLQKYIESYAEGSTRGLAEWICSENRCWQEVLVVPACGEGAEFYQLISHLQEHVACLNKSILLVVVVNESSKTAPSLVAKNAIFLRYWKSRLKELKACSLRRAFFGELGDGLTVLLLDHTVDNKFPSNQGVGLARKIGCDLALSCILCGAISSSWIHTTDADAILPADYFTRNMGSRKDAVARIYPFEHRQDFSACQRQIHAAALYDRYLRYLESGLRFAGSPYAFQTVGSTLAVEYRAYAKVRGFPKRMAGEDFYFLNKLAKLGPIVEMYGAPILLSGRISARVPFGTGVGIGKIQGALSGKGEYLVYHPLAFVLLKSFLEIVREVSNPGGSYKDPWQHLLEVCENGQPGFVEPDCLDALLGGELRQQLKRIAGCSSDAAAFMRHFHTWFDGFKTQKWLRAVCEQHLGMISIESLHSILINDEKPRPQNFMGSRPIRAV